MSKALNALQAKHPDKIAEWYRDSDGYWIGLRPGWQWGGGSIVHEWTVRDVLAAFRDVEEADHE